MREHGWRWMLHSALGPTDLLSRVFNWWGSGSLSFFCALCEKIHVKPVELYSPPTHKIIKFKCLTEIFFNFCKENTEATGAVNLHMVSTFVGNILNGQLQIFFCLEDNRNALKLTKKPTHQTFFHKLFSMTCSS